MIATSNLLLKKESRTNIRGNLEQGNFVMHGFIGMICILSVIRIPTMPITFGALIGVFLFPVLFSSARVVGLFRPMAIFICGLTSIGIGLFVLPAVSMQIDPGRSHDWQSAIHQVLIFMSALLTLIVLVYCFDFLGIRLGLVLSALGLGFSSIFLSPSFAMNPWKYGVGFAISIIAIALVMRKSFGIQAGLVLFLCAVSLAYESRNLALVLLTALVAFITVRIFKKQLDRRQRIGALSILILFIWLAIKSVNYLALSGYFGDVLARRQAEQLQNGGLLGGRTEYGAFIELLSNFPMGYGLGVLPSSLDISIGKSGMKNVGGGGGGEYVDNRMFGSTIQLHSIIGDFWVQLGIIGIFISFLIIVTYSIAAWAVPNIDEELILLCLFLLLGGMWDMLFSPFYANYAVLSITLALSISIMRLYGKSMGTQESRRPLWVLHSQQVTTLRGRH